MAEMPRSILQIAHQSGNVYHFDGKVTLFTEETGIKDWNRPTGDPELLVRIASSGVYALGDGKLYLCKPFESVQYVTEAERRATELKATKRLTRVETDLLNNK